MKRVLTGILYSVIIASCLNVSAQKTMMDEVSIPYLEKLIEVAKLNYPRHKIFAKQIGIAQSNLSKIQLSWFDGLGVYYLYLPPNSVGNTVNPTTNRSGFQLGFSLNFGSLLEKPAQIKAAKGDKQVAVLEKDEYDLTIAEQVKERYFKYTQQVTLLKLRAQLLLDAQTLVTSSRNKFEQGQESFENYNKIQTSYNQQNQDKITSEAEMLIAKAQLEELLNKKLEDIKLDDTK
ncbi:MAG: TolC family protein [Bacteroidota bacterium]|nr:TolC family protein [Bacteroidota bacterium]